MKKTYINPELEVVVIGITQPLMTGSLITTGDVDVPFDGDSDGGLIADGHEFDNFFDAEESFTFE